MGLKQYSAVLISSNDFWRHDPDSYDKETKLFNDFSVIKSDAKSDDETLHNCAYYFEVGLADNHGFKPISIKYDEDEGFLIIVGEQGSMGKQKKRVFQIGEDARRYKHMQGPRHSVDYIIPSKSENREEIKNFIEENLQKEAETFQADTLNQINPTIVEGSEDIMGAESFEAETLNQINPVAVEGAEDIMNAEDFSADTMNQINPTFVEGSEDIMGAEYEYCSCESPRIRHAGVHPRASEACNLIVEAEVDVQHIKDLGNSFDDDDGLPEETYSATWSLINQGMGPNTAMRWTRAVEGQDNRFYLQEPFDFGLPPYDAEDVVELVQEVSPFPMGKLFASFIVVGVSAIAGAKLLNR